MDSKLVPIVFLGGAPPRPTRTFPFTQEGSGPPHTSLIFAGGSPTFIYVVEPLSKSRSRENLAGQPKMWGCRGAGASDANGRQWGCCAPAQNTIGASFLASKMEKQVQGFLVHTCNRATENDAEPSGHFHQMFPGPVLTAFIMRSSPTSAPFCSHVHTRFFGSFLKGILIISVLQASKRVRKVSQQPTLQGRVYRCLTCVSRETRL